MKKTLNRFVSFVLCLALCLGLCTVAFAADPDLSLTLDTYTAEKGNLPSTVSMTIATTETLEIMSFSGEAYSEDSRITISAIQDGDKELSAFSTTTGRFAYLVSAEKSVTTWATVVFTIPSDLDVGTYTLGVRSVLTSKTDNSNPISGVTEKTVTFPVTDPAPAEGYTVTMSSSADTVESGDSVDVYLDVSYYSSSAEGSTNSYAAFLATLTYNSSLFTYTAPAEATALNGFEVTEATPGTLNISRANEPVTISDSHELTLAFTAAEVTTETQGVFTLADGTQVDTEANARYGDSPIAAIVGSPLTITVAPKVVLESIAVTTQPTKTEYKVGDTFDATGMVVTATYSDSSTAPVTGYSVTPDPLTVGTTAVTVSYTEDGITKTATVPVTVKNDLVSIAVTTQPDKTAYTAGESFDSTGMVVTATYLDGSTAPVTGYTVDTTTLNTVGTATVTVSYTEGEITKTATITVTVAEDTTPRVEVTESFTNYLGTGYTLIKVEAKNLPEGNVPTYDGNPMFQIKNAAGGTFYDETAYYYIVITNIYDEANVAYGEGTATVIDHTSADANNTGLVDINDAQFAYNVYNRYYGDLTAAELLRADVNGDGTITVQDSAAVVTAIFTSGT